MAHKEQVEYCESVKKRLPIFFKEKLVLDIGSLDINGNNRYLFDSCLYIGVDIGRGRNVDLVSKGHELLLPDASLDVVISTECLEHDMYYAETLKNIVRILKPGGMLVFTCATTGRPEHGTRRTTPSDAPLLSSESDWSDYYKNLTESDIRTIFDVENTFQSFAFSDNRQSCDLYFWGIKQGLFIERFDYSFQSEDSVFNKLKVNQQLLTVCETELRNTQEKLKAIEMSSSWRMTKPIRKLLDMVKTTSR